MSPYPVESTDGVTVCSARTAPPETHDFSRRSHNTV